MKGSSKEVIRQKKQILSSVKRGPHVQEGDLFHHRGSKYLITEGNREERGLSEKRDHGCRTGVTTNPIKTPKSSSGGGNRRSVEEAKGKVKISVERNPRTDQQTKPRRRVPRRQKYG